MIRIFGGNAKVLGTAISSGSATLDVRNGCNGVHALLILASAILASPVLWRRRLVGALLGAVMVFAFNVVRLMVLLFVARHSPDWLELFHIYVLQTLVLLSVFSLYVVWAIRASDYR